ncbi:MAG: heavy metal-associated domain-containing protein [Thermodesulfobacteriota bacterium]
MKKVSIIASVFTGLLLFVSLAHGAELRRTVTRVSGMQCGSCLRVIDAELRKVPGVTGMTAVFREELVTVYHEQEVTPNEITGVISKLGYQATVVSSQGIPEDKAVSFQKPGFGCGSGCSNPGGSNPVADSWNELRRRIFKGRSRGSGGFRQAPESPGR